MNKSFLISTIFLIFGLSSFTYSQTKPGINYQALVRNNDGEVLKNETISIRPSIIKTSFDGNVIYQELHSVETNDLGIFSIIIGNGENISGSFLDIEWGKSDHFIQIEIMTSQQADFELLGVSQILSVPYSYFSDKANFSNSSDSSSFSKNSERSIIADSALISYSSISSDSSLFSKHSQYTVIADSALISYNSINSDTAVFSLSSRESYFSTISDSSKFALQAANANPEDELQNFDFSVLGDSLYLSKGNYVIIPGLSLANAVSPIIELDVIDSTITSNSTQLIGKISLPEKTAPLASIVLQYDISSDFNSPDSRVINTLDFDINLSPLMQSSDYYVRIVVETDLKTYYSETVSFQTISAPLQIGDLYEGGIVFRLDESGLHGSIVTSDKTEEQINALELSFLVWGCQGTDIPGADQTAIGTGFTNTEEIAAAPCGPSNAAELVWYFPLNGFNDWYLPSRDELVLINTNLTTEGLFEDKLYWTSSESGADQAFAVNPITGEFTLVQKSTVLDIIFVRDF